MIGCGMDSFEPERPRDFTIGRLTPVENLGAQGQGHPGRHGLPGDGVQLPGLRQGLYRADERARRRGAAHSQSHDGELRVRPSVHSALPAGFRIGVRQGRVPARVFEAGKVAFKDGAENYGTATRTFLGFLSAHAEANYNEAASLVSALLYYLGAEYAVEDCDDPRFIAGRQARILQAGKPVGDLRRNPSAGARELGCYGALRSRRGGPGSLSLEGPLHGLQKTFRSLIPAGRTGTSQSFSRELQEPMGIPSPSGLVRREWMKAIGT